MPIGALTGIFVSSWVVGLSGAVSPGPVLALDIRESARSGFWAGPAIVLGHALLELVTVAALYLGLAQFIKDGPGFIAVALVGGGVLLWMAWNMLRRPGAGAPSATMTAAGHASQRVGIGPVFGGVLVSLSNPFWAIWWATVCCCQGKMSGSIVQRLCQPPLFWLVGLAGLLS